MSGFEDFTFKSWYPLLRDYTIPSEIVRVPRVFIDYLRSDGIYAPIDENGKEYTPYHRSFDSDYDESMTDSTDTEDDTIRLYKSHPDIIELSRSLQKIINDLGGSVFPKFELSCPRDAAWMMTSGTLKCSSSAEVFILFKGSDFISFDLQVLSEKVDDFHITLRQWKDINHGMEFRCFVNEGKLVGISQRDYRTFYDYLPGLEPKILEYIKMFWENVIKKKILFDRFAFDVVLDYNHRLKQFKRALLIDINPFTPRTDCYLFEVDELKNKSDSLELRIIHNRMEASKYQNCAPLFQFNMLPQEAILLSQGQTLAEFARLIKDEVEIASK